MYVANYYIALYIPHGKVIKSNCSSVSESAQTTRSVTTGMLRPL